MILCDDQLDLRGPIGVVSDMHLGHPASFVVDVEKLAPLFDGLSTVVFNGDAQELNSAIRRADAKRSTEALVEMLRRRGVRPIFVAGNHDARASSLTGLYLADRRVFVTHGDSLHPDLAPWSGEATALRRERRRLIEAGSNVRTFEDELHLIKRMAVVASLYDKRKKSGMAGRIEIVSKFARKPKRAVKVIKFWTNVPTFADEYHNRFIPSARHLIIGHTHRAGVWRRRDYTLINTGSFQPLSGTLIVRVDGRSVSTRRVVRTADGFRLGAIVSDECVETRESFRVGSLSQALRAFAKGRKPPVDRAKAV